MITSYKSFFRLPRFKRMLIYTNNYCNLHCEKCVTLSALPITPNSEYLKRREKYEVPIEDVALFCERFKGIGENDLHRLEGGEPTAMPPEKIGEIIEVLTAYDRRISIMTNGFNLLGMGKNRLNQIHEICLDDHGINHAHLMKCIKYLKSFYKGKIDKINVSYHYDLYKVRKHPKNQGKTCEAMMHLFELNHGVLFPCCILPFIEEFNKTTHISNELTKAGWHLNNHDVTNQMKNWRKTLPAYIGGQCLYNCWFPHVKLGQKYRITLKPNDVVAKVNP